MVFFIGNRFVFISIIWEGIFFGGIVGCWRRRCGLVFFVNVFVVFIGNSFFVFCIVWKNVFFRGVVSCWRRRFFCSVVDVLVFLVSNSFVFVNVVGERG